MRAVPKRYAGALLLVAAAVWACADREVPSSPERGIRPEASSTPDVTPLAQYTSALTLPTSVVDKLIGPEGGSLSLGGFEVVVPPGAVTEPTLFSIDLPLEDVLLGAYVLASFAPHGQQFAAPVTLRLPYAGTTAEGNESRVLWWDGGAWVPLETTRTADGRIEAKTSHFSEYGTEEERGITVAGG
ncbi:MAG: hypothetical protein HY561_12920 [Gemmatimonadetes bacterium]|nr:hypothetical protein [Gemmatimonadota bacterium]